MYSLVLMMALTPSADAPTFLGRGGNCNGCNGCSGASCSGCTGSSCHGCSGSSCNGCKGGGGFLGGRKNKGCNGCSGCHGCTGSTGCCGGAAAGCHGCAGGAPAAKPADPKPADPKPAAMAAPATIVVTLPADAKLSIDGAATRSTTGTRTFVTPALESGKEYSYTLKAEVVRDGQSFSTEQRVSVRGGAESKINLQIPVTSVSAQ